MWGRPKGPGKWCPENDGAWQAEQAAIHRERARQTAPDPELMELVGMEVAELLKQHKGD